MEAHESRIRTLEKQVRSLQRVTHEHSEKFDTFVETPLCKRLLFFLQGYKFRHLGRWYHAPWNESAAKWDAD